MNNYGRKYFGETMEYENKYLDEFEAILEEILIKEGLEELPESMIKIQEISEISETTE